VPIRAKMKIHDLMEEHPEVDEVFENYGVEVTDEVMAMTLKELCRDEGINYWELKADMVEAVGWDGSADVDDDEESEEDDEWTDDEDGEEEEEDAAGEDEEFEDEEDEDEDGEEGEDDEEGDPSGDDD